MTDFIHQLPCGCKITFCNGDYNRTYSAFCGRHYHDAAAQSRMRRDALRMIRDDCIQPRKESA